MKSDISVALPRSGARIIGEDLNLLVRERRIEYSSGIVRAEEQYPCPPYWKRAFVPRLPWRQLKSHEYGEVFGDATQAAPGEGIRIIHVPEPVIRELEVPHYGATSISDPRVKRYLVSEGCALAAARVSEYVSQRCGGGDPAVLEGAGVFVKDPGLPTCTSHKGRFLLGLHIDSLYEVPLVDRPGSPLRLNINIGREDRFFLYVRPCVPQMMDALMKSRCQYTEEEGSPTHGLRTAFMTAFPELSVVKVRIGPGDGYIAPTENLLHDGCTVGQTEVDIQYSVRGWF